jgi:uncharacterized protein YkwD
MRQRLSVIVSGGLALCCFLSAGAPAVSAADAGILRSISAQRRLQRLAERRVSRTLSVQPSTTGKAGQFTARPTIRKIREIAMRNAAAERRIVERPVRTSSRSSRSSSSSSSSSSSYHSAAPIQTGDIDEEKLRLLELVNNVRVENGLSPLSYNMTLERAAQLYAEEMQQGNFFSHESPDGTTFDKRIQREGYPGPCPQAGCRVQLYLGENLAKGFDSPETVLEGWMNSPGHRANILNEHFAEVGFGVAGIYWTQSFGKAVFSN